MFLLRDKLITQGQKRPETSTKTRDKLRVFVSRISPPLLWLSMELIYPTPSPFMPDEDNNSGGS